MWMIVKYILRTITPADITRCILTLFLIYLVYQEGFYTGFAISIIFIRYEIELAIKRVKEDLANNPEKIVNTVILDELAKEAMKEK